MRARSLLLSLVATPGATGASASRSPDGWQCALSFLGLTIALHFRMFDV